MSVPVDKIGTKHVPESSDFVRIRRTEPAGPGQRPGGVRGAGPGCHQLGGSERGANFIRASLCWSVNGLDSLIPEVPSQTLILWFYDTEHAATV